jgi:hypothetical protein
MSNKLSANVGITDNNAEADARYLAIPLTEKATETIVLIVNSISGLTYLMPVIWFIQEEFDIVDWVIFENWWRAYQTIPRHKLQEWHEHATE